GARYFASSIGRLMTPDWAARPTAVPYAVFGDPQSLNLYTYVRNDPISRADADGHGCESTGHPSDCSSQTTIIESQKQKAAQNTVTVARVETIGTNANQDGT